MGMRTGVNAPALLVDKYINTAYDNVKKVADSIDNVNTLADNLELIDDVAEDFNIVVSNLNDVVAVGVNINHVITNSNNIVVIQSANANALSAEASKVQASEAADRASAAALTLIAAGTILPTCSNTAFSDIYGPVIDLGTIELDPPTYFAIENIPVVRVDLSSSIENTQYDFAEL
jgi:hypothetical protein